MSNHYLKAKNKQTGEIVDFTAMDYGYTYRYIENIKNRVFLPDGTLENPEYFTPQEFNELYEIVEDEIVKKDKDTFYTRTLHSSLLCNDTGCTICVNQRSNKSDTGDTAQKPKYGTGYPLPDLYRPEHETWQGKLYFKSYNEMSGDGNGGLEKGELIVELKDAKEVFQQELDRICEDSSKRKYTFKKVRWGGDDWFETIQNCQDDTKCTAYCEGYNQAIDDIINIIKK